MTSPIRLSVIICSYDRYESLEQTLAVLVASRGATGPDCEIVVVENTPAASRQPIMLPSANSRIIVCDEVGLSAARNYGIEHSTGGILAFLDDDALVCPDWCMQIIRSTIERPKARVIGGKVIPRYSSDRLPKWYDSKLSGHLSCIDWGPRTRLLRAGEWIVGANMVFRRDVFQEFGKFETALGRKGGSSLLSNEEISLLERIGMQNVVYSPDILVEHVISSERLTPQWFRKRVYWQAISDMVAGLAAGSVKSLRTE